MDETGIPYVTGKAGGKGNKNPEFAVQIATNVIIAISITGQQKQFGSLETLFAQLAAQM